MATRRVRLEADGTFHTTDASPQPVRGRVDWARVDATTEAEIARHAAEDDKAAAQAAVSAAAPA
ncbi:hypothetical protein [Neoroseomonas oryzicola]|uniref:hypothetical protein n=1 Tax=Neoroseomonas oryzicola TaxID=535904 RepID=UPI001AE09E56|nr:hypothetical protein [Neoroseomonas oryzicola]